MANTEGANDPRVGMADGYGSTHGATDMHTDIHSLTLREEAEAYQALLDALSRRDATKDIGELVRAWRNARQRVASADQDLIARSRQSVTCSWRSLQPAAEARRSPASIDPPPSALEKRATQETPSVSPAQWVVYFSLEIRQVVPGMSKARAVRLAKRAYSVSLTPEKAAHALAREIRVAP